MVVVRNVEHTDDKKMFGKWQDFISIHEEFAVVKETMFDVLTAFASIWDAHQGRIKATKHRNGLTSPDVHHSHWAPYRSCRKARILEKEDLKKDDQNGHD